MESNLELLLEIEKRPGLYLGRKSVTLLETFMDGYLLGLGQGKYENETLTNFQKFLLEKYSLNTDHSWSEILLFYAGNEERGFDHFYDLFRTFLANENREKQ